MAIYVNFEGLEQASADVGTTKTKFGENMASLIQTVEETTNNDWKGPDAQLFVTNTKTKLQKLQDEYDQFFQELMNAIDNNHDKFKDVIQANINAQG